MRLAPRISAPLLAGLCYVAIIGPHQQLRGEDWPGDIEYAFRLLKQRVHQEGGPSEIYALLSIASQIVIEVNADEETLKYDEGIGRTRERTLKSTELAKFKRWLATNKVDQLPPCDDNFFGHLRYEYVHLARDGTDRHVPINNRANSKPPPAGNEPDSTAAPEPKLYRTLIKRFSDLASVPMPVRYKSIEHLAGFKVVYAGEKGDAAELSFRNEDLFACIRDETPKLWHEVKENGMSAKGVREPSDPLLREWYPRYYASDTDHIEPKAGPYGGKSIWAGTRKEDGLEGLWVSGIKGEPEFIAGGDFGRFVLSPDGEWLVCQRVRRESEDRQISIVRIHLRKKEIMPVALPEADMLLAIAWVEAHQKVILFRERSYDRIGPDEREYFLLDVATGNSETVAGEFRPLTDYNWVPLRLQPSSEANVFWATIDNEKPEHPGEFDSDFGRYNTHDFSFTPILHLPGVRLDSDKIWVDENTHTLWMILNSDIARVQF